MLNVNYEATVIHECSNSSTEFYIRPYLKRAGLSYRVLDQHASRDDMEKLGAWVGLVRYVPRRLLPIIERRRGQIEQLIYFMDDDLFSMGASLGMPWRYRWKIARLATWRQSWLRDVGAQLWVSNVYLYNKYSTWKPRILEARPLDTVSENRLIRVFYHGSASHSTEIGWLYSVIEAVLKCNENITFEIIGDKRVNRDFRTLPRVSVVHPMPWESYLCFCSFGTRNIGLAPLLPHPFNRGRSATKFFDITRCGAVGIYGAVTPYADFVRDGVDGLLVPHDTGAWVDAILSLASDDELRGQLLTNAVERVRQLQVAECSK